MRGLIISFLIGLSPAWAGYRVHQLKVTHYSPKGKVAATEKVLSTLDPYQYEHHHGGFRNMRVVMEDTWYCPGDTSRQEYCTKPKSSPRRGPASTDPKRGEIPLNRQPIRPQ